MSWLLSGLKIQPFVIVPLIGIAVLAQQPDKPTQPMNAPRSATVDYSAIFKLPNSRNPLSAYSPSSAPEPQLTNSPDLNQLIRDGKLYLSLSDAIRLALENNLDLAIARYNLPIA